jgi:hypothetical protein
VLEMITEKEAREIFLAYINKGLPDKELRVITRINLSKRSDCWIIHFDASSPDFGLCGNYGFLLEISSKKLIACGYDGPEIYLEDKYEADDLAGKQYVLRPNLDANKQSILLVKRIFGIDYRKAIRLVKENKYWYSGKKRYLNRVEKLLGEKGIEFYLEVADESSAFLNVDTAYWSLQEPIGELLDKI